MEYSEKLAEEESWGAFESALEDAVQNYVESFKEHLEDDQSNYKLTIPDIESDKDLLESLEINEYSVERKAIDRNLRSYDIELPDTEEPLMVEVERSVAENTIAADEDRETVAYTMLPRSDHERKFKNIQSEFCRLTQPDAVKENASLFYREGIKNPLRELDSWETFDEYGVMEDAIQSYEENFPADLDFNVELGFDSGKDWRIYEFDFEDVDEPLHLEVTLHDRGFSFNWRPDDYGMRYRNFVREGFAKAIESINDGSF